jgi:23S rRNA (guanosine2251-2'-O)-methyltransferase
VIIYGLNPILEALRAGGVRHLWVGGRADRRVQEVLRLASAAGVPVQHVDPSHLDRAARGGLHQGVVAEIADAASYDVADLLRLAHGTPLVVVLDGVEDPHNFGAILRVADAAGVDGVVRQTRRAAGLDGVAAKASAGAMAHVRIATVVNVARAIEELKDANVWTVGLAGDAAACYCDLDLTLPTAVVLGSEGTGLRRIVRAKCDRLASIPMRGQIGSLNVSVAAGVVLFEAVRQRRGVAGPDGERRVGGGPGGPRG